MKKLIRFAALLLVFVLILSGCAGNEDKPEAQQTPEPQESSEPQESTEPQESEQTDPGYEAQPVYTGQSYQDTLLDRIPFTVDIGPGWEYRDLDVNGEFRRIAVQFEMESSVIDQDPCYTYYYVDIHGEDLGAEVVATGRAYLNDYMTQYVRECKAANDIESIDFMIFEDDFRASTFKGKDKEYIVFSIPANWEPDTSTLVIATDQGKLLADSVIDKSYQVTLEGEDTNKYMDSQGNANFFSFSEESITYLKAVQTVDGVTTLREYALEIDGDTITPVETGRTYTTKDTVPELPDLSIY